MVLDWVSIWLIVAISACNIMHQNCKMFSPFGGMTATVVPWVQAFAQASFFAKCWSRRLHSIISFHIPSLTHPLVHVFVCSIGSFSRSNHKTHSRFLSAKVRNAQECQDRCTVDNSCECVVWVLDGTQRQDPGLQIRGVAEECPPMSTPETIRTTSDLL